MHITRSKLVAPAVALLLTMGAIVATWLLVDRASSSGGAEIQIASMRLSLADLQAAPFNADPHTGGSPRLSRITIEGYEASLSAGLSTRAQTGVPLDLLEAGRASLTAIHPVVGSIYRIALEKGGLVAAGSRVPALQKLLKARSAALTGVLSAISRADATRAAGARGRIKLGASLAMGLLLLSFMFFYFRSVAARDSVGRLMREKEAMLGLSRVEARTDALTGLANRRALASDLASAIAEPPGPHELLLAMFDLDGFKQYNDTFGHAAGDALLRRLGGCLAVTVGSAGSAFRMGGDEFCMLARCTPDAAERLLDDAVAALEESGEGWRVGCSHGAAWIPSEAATETDALSLADERMYANKAGRSSASRQVTDALLQVITEQNACLDQHVEHVAELAVEVAQALGMSEHEVWQVGGAARLHGIGKTAIPAAILGKPGPLNEQEWEFMRRHPLIGERIALAAPALASTAPLIRSSHERMDGTGYPDGLAGPDIPQGARIIAVCNAFDAMTSHRRYRRTIGVGAAVEELERNAGTQFDGAVVAAFCEAISVNRNFAEKPPASVCGA